MEKKVKKVKKVLIVDDMKSSAKLMEYLINIVKLECKIVNDGQLAIKENLKEYDVILMDLEMPIMNGIETTKYIRENLFSDIPIYGITGYNKLEIDYYTELGFTGMFTKPLSFETLKLILRNLD